MSRLTVFDRWDRDVFRTDAYPPFQPALCLRAQLCRVFKNRGELRPLPHNAHAPYASITHTTATRAACNRFHSGKYLATWLNAEIFNVTQRWQLWAETSLPISVCSCRLGPLSRPSHRSQRTSAFHPFRRHQPVFDRTHLLLINTVWDQQMNTVIAQKMLRCSCRSLDINLV